MSRWIDADALITRLKGYNPQTSRIKTAQTVTDCMPSIDIVFCEDCRDCVETGTGVDCPSGYGYLYCRRKKSAVNEDDYCSWGERKSE